MEHSKFEPPMLDGLKTSADCLASGHSLGDAKLVEQLVRHFMFEVFSQRSKFHTTGDGTAAETWINQLCASYGDLFMGNNKQYVATAWNSRYQLGAYLRAVVPDVADFSTPCEAYFQFLAVQALNAAIALENGDSEDRVKAELAEVVDDAMNVLLGRKADCRIPD